MPSNPTGATTPESDTVHAAVNDVIIERQRKLIAYATKRTADGFPLHLADTGYALECRNTLAGKALQRAAREGALVKLAGRDGWIAAGPLAPSMRRASLADLIDLARSRTTSDAVAHRGRRALHESHEIERLTPGQFADIERLVALILRHEPFAEGNASRIGDGAFGWDALAHGGRGGWALSAKVRAWAEEEHRAKHEARAARGGSTLEAWTPTLALATVRDYAGAASNLLHLAATAGVISRSPMASGGNAGMLYAPCWVPIIERMVRWSGVHGDAGNPRRRYVGARTLAVVATRLGGRSLRSTDWLAVRDALERARRDGTIPRTRFEAARYVWRGVVGALRARLVVSESFDWPISGDTRVSLVSAAAIRAAGVIEVAPAARDFSEWRTLDGAPATELVEGDYGVRAFAAWSTVDALTLRLNGSTLPLRAWAKESSVARPRRKGKAPLQVTGSTLETRLQTIARLAGFAARECGVDWRTADLRTLVEPAFLECYAQWIGTLPRDRRGPRHSTLADAIKTMGWIANGFLSAQARRRNERAWLDTLGTWYHAAEGLASAIPTPVHKDWRLVRKSVVAIATAWRGFDNEDGLMKLRTLVVALESDLKYAADGRSLAAQRDAIARGAWQPTVTWARTLRLLCIVLLAQRVPLRGHTVARMTCEMWKSSPVGRLQQDHARAQRLPPWEGAIALDLPGSIMKSRRPFSPPLLLPEHVSADVQAGQTVQEESFRRDMWQLWMMPGGGRDHCRTVRNPLTGASEVLDVPWLFPDPVRAEIRAPRSIGRTRTAAKKGPKPNGGKSAADGLWSRSALSDAFKRAVLRHADALHIDVSQMRTTRGALGFHAVRRLFGTHWAPSQLVKCSRLLDHTSVEMTLRIYVGIDERSMSLVVGAA